MPVPLIHPSSLVIAGPSRSGKTTFLRKLFEQRMIYPFPVKIVLVFGEWQKEYDRMRTMLPIIEFVKGPMSEELYDQFDPAIENMLVLDDQMTDAGNTNQLEKYFVQGSHHKNLTVVFIVQNIFNKGKAMRSSTLNTNYLTLYKSPRDRAQIGCLGRQMYPDKWRAFLAAFQHATEDPYTYMLVDLLPDTPDEYRLRGNIFNEDGYTFTDVYIIDSK
jgi:hypothetical protein